MLPLAPFLTVCLKLKLATPVLFATSLGEPLFLFSPFAEWVLGALAFLSPSPHAPTFPCCAWPLPCHPWQVSPSYCAPSSTAKDMWILGPCQSMPQTPTILEACCSTSVSRKGVSFVGTLSSLSNRMCPTSLHTSACICPLPPLRTCACWGNSEQWATLLD